MSTYLGSWYSSTTISSLEARSIYEKLCREEPVDLEENENVSRFLAELNKHYPDPSRLNFEQMKDTPWASSFKFSIRYILLSISYRAPEGLYKFVVDLALKNGLICFDPYDDSVYLPDKNY